MKYTEEIRDLFSVPEHYYLAQCISADLGMGAGIAVEFNKRFDMKKKLLQEYNTSCVTAWDQKPEGQCILKDRVFNLITKRNYWLKPTYQTLTDSLVKMRDIAVAEHIDKIAMPLIGSGLDKLQWNKVSEIVRSVFEDTDIEILVCRQKERKQTMDTQKQKQLEKQLQKQLGIHSRAELKVWKETPYLMNTEAATKFWDMVNSASAVKIVGDYDCDGVCACYVMSKAIRHKYPQKDIGVRIPKRISEGYGINPKIVEEIKANFPKDGLIITVDNGIAAAECLEDLKKSGYKVIVTDHHELGKNKIPDVDMVLNPKVPIDGVNYFNGDYWCGAAVAYKLAEQFVSEDMRKELEIFAGIATVGDIMTLKEGNWGLVRRTLERIKKGDAPESVLSLLIALNQRIENISEESFGYYLVPAINAAGRLLDDGAKKPLSYFLKPTPEKRQELVGINEERKALRDQQVEEVVTAIEEQGLQNDCPIWVCVNGLHEGIVGIIAGQIAEKYEVPAIVLTESSTPGVVKGSARSYGDADIFKYLLGVSDLLERFGGHTGAAGLSLKEENVAKVRKSQIAKPQSIGNQIEMKICPEEIKDMADTTDIYRPFGEGNPEPKFTVDVNLDKSIPRMLGADKSHLCINDPLKQYKMMHFFHEPNDLKNKKEFKMIGGIHHETFNGYTTSVMQAEKVEDLEMDDFDRGR